MVRKVEINWRDREVTAPLHYTPGDYRQSGGYDVDSGVEIRHPSGRVFAKLYGRMPERLRAELERELLSAARGAL